VGSGQNGIHAVSERGGYVGGVKKGEAINDGKYLGGNTTRKGSFFGSGKKWEGELDKLLNFK